MKKIISMIALVAVFGSTNVMADCAGDLTSMGLTSSMRSSSVIALCENNSKAASVVSGAKANGYVIKSTPGMTRTTHGSAKTVWVGQVGKDDRCDGSNQVVKVQYAIIHELYHAANPGSQSIANETAAVKNTNYIRKNEGRVQRSSYGGTALSGVCI